METAYFGVGFVPLVIGLVEVAKRAGLPSRFAPLLSLFLGVGLMFAVGADIIQATVLGLAVGLSASGLYSGVRASIGE